jgi:hypothetical protein
MQIRVTKTFLSDLSSQPLLTNELFDLPDAVAKKLIAEGHAQAWTLNADPTPPKRKRERAVRP